MKKIWFKSAILALAGLSTTSCGDFLDIYPLTMVYEDNFWTEKADVDQILAGCYTRMQDDDFMRRLFIWGEVRSDNVIANIGSPKYNNTSPEAYLSVENLLSTNTYTDWSSFYSVIDRCNLIIERAPQVAAVDPSFLESDVNATIAEASALRALCYFYLVRTFNDVPYYTNAITNDEQPLALPATSGDVIIRNLIADLEGVYSYALTAWPSQSGVEGNVSAFRITQWAIFSLLADMNLWIGNYTAAADYAQRVIKYKTESFEGSYPSTYMVNGYPLFPDNDGVSLSRGYAFNQLFGTGGSPESIFELYFSDRTDDNTKSNVMVRAFYYNFIQEGNTWAQFEPGYFTPTDALERAASNGDTEIFPTSSDSRIRESLYLDPLSSGTSDDSYRMGKYIFTSVTLSSDNSQAVYGGRTEKNAANWIFYRVSDMMLIRAEALIYQMSGDGSEHDDELGSEAFDLIKAVADRSAPRATGSGLVYSNYSTKNSLIELLFAERRREFLFEGKRWFDLVRRSRRDGNTDYLVNQVRSKFSSTTSISKFGNFNAIYWPYNYDELRVNPNLVQNPAYPETSGDSYESTR